MPHQFFESDFAHSIYKERYSFDGSEEWPTTSQRVVGSVMGVVDADPEPIFELMRDKRFCPGGRYLYAAGRDYHQVNNCVLLNCPDSREGWASTSYKAEMALCSGAGIGVWYGDVREEGALIRRTGGTASGPLPKMCQVNDTGRHVMQGGNRRSAIWAGLPWWHPDIFKFITCKDWSDDIKALKEDDPTFPAPMDFTNISVGLDDRFFKAYQGPVRASQAWTKDEDAPDGSTWQDWAQRVYWTAVAHMLRHGEPGFSINTGEQSAEVLRNACTEITSAHDSDVCNLGSLVLPRFNNLQRFEDAVRQGALFLTAGSVYSDVPYEEVEAVRELNRRLGLGLIGVHEFLMQRGVRYGTEQAFEVLEPYMLVYNRALEFAWDWQDKLGLSRSVAAKAIAPNGTIGIVMESTPSADPMLSAAESRTTKIARPGGDELVSRIVIDPTAARLRKQGIHPDLIEDTYTISHERRLAQQAFLQQFVDQSISSTVNIPAPVTDKTEVRSIGDTLMRHLPLLRGVTFYPDGARAGQPRVPVDLDWALSLNGNATLATDDSCINGVCGV